MLISTFIKKQVHTVTAYIFLYDASVSIHRSLLAIALEEYVETPSRPWSEDDSQ